MIAQMLVLFVVPALLALAAGWDLASFTIPNFLSLILIAAFVLFAGAAHMPLAAAGLHGLAGAAGLAVSFTLFALGYVGGGDAKLFAAIALWFGFGSVVDFTLVAALFGGGLALALLSLRSLPLPAALSGQGWINRLHDEKSGIPYGVALSAGALVILPHTDVFRLAF
ncbi:MAG: prepilin peptidase [Alphaproteobacteria bacterium]|nr:prepilin peptidase [Alphaproteobacteria bacterium]